MKAIQETKEIFKSSLRAGINLINRLGSKYSTEIATYKSSYFDESQEDPYNPNELVISKDYDIYDKMMIDDQVKASFTIKKLLISSRNWFIKPASDDIADKKIADNITYLLTDGFNGNFKNVIDETLLALQYGFSIIEKIFEIKKNINDKSLIGLKYLKSKPPHSFEFHLDDYGNIEMLLQHQLNGDMPLDPKKFIIYSYNTKFGNPYGRSDLNSAYRSWFIKDKNIKFWSIYLERHGMPLIKGKYKPGLSPDDKTKLEKILNRLQAKTVYAIPDNVDIDFLEAKNGTISYESAIKMHNKMIANSFLLPELLGFSEHSTGSQALGKEQFALFYKILEDIQIDIEDIFNEQLIKQLTNLNYLNIKYYPKFQFEDIEDEEKKEAKFRIWNEFLKTGAIVQTAKDEEYIRNQLGFPIKEKIEKEDINTKQPNNENIKEEKTKEEKLKFAENSSKRQPSEFIKKADIKEIAKEQEVLFENMITDIGKVITDIGDSIILTIMNKKIIPNKNFPAINKITISNEDIKRLSRKFLQNMEKSYKQSKRTALDNLKGKIKKFTAAADVTGSLIPREAISYLSSKSIAVTGTESEFILKSTKDILMSGLKNGKTESEIVFELKNFFADYKVEQLSIKTGKLERIEDIKGRLNTVVRTNLSDAYNQGRNDAFNDKNVADFIEAYEYSAILDDRTTDFCESYNGKIYAKNDPIWDNLTPPNHFNCRSLLIPIVQGDKYTLNKPLAIQQPVRFGGKEVLIKKEE